MMNRAIIGAAMDKAFQEPWVKLRYCDSEVRTMPQTTAGMPIHSLQTDQSYQEYSKSLFLPDTSTAQELRSNMTALEFFYRGSVPDFIFD